MKTNTLTNNKCLDKKQMSRHMADGQRATISKQQQKTSGAISVHVMPRVGRRKQKEITPNMKEHGNITIRLHGRKLTNSVCIYIYIYMYTHIHIDI